MPYIPRHFLRTDPDALHALVREAPLALLVTVVEGQALVSHVPLVLDCEGGVTRLLGHLATANPQARAPDPGTEAVAVFTGPGAYVSPGWYASRAAHGRVVPTWNYAAVYATGELSFLDGHDPAHAVVSVLTDVHESGRSDPWAVGDAPADFVEAQLRAVRAFELRVRTLEGKWKMSQNRDAADREGVRRGLAAEPGPAAAAVLAAMGPTDHGPGG